MDTLSTAIVSNLFLLQYLTYTNKHLCISKMYRCLFFIYSTRDTKMYHSLSYPFLGVGVDNLLHHVEASSTVIGVSRKAPPTYQRKAYHGYL